MRKYNLLLTIGIVLLLVVTAVLGNEYRKIDNIVDTLEAENEELEEALNTESLKTYADQLPEEKKFGGYEDWKAAKELSEYLYEDSDGKFKKDWGLFLAIEAETKDIDPLLLYELLKVETGGKFDPETVGPQTKYGRAYGMAQFMKNTAPWIAEMAGLDYDEEKLFNPYYSIQLSITYLDFLYNQYGDWDYALTAYHRGIYGLEKYIQDNGHARSWYAVEIQENAEDSDLVAYDD